VACVSSNVYGPTDVIASSPNFPRRRPNPESAQNSSRELGMSVRTPAMMKTGVLAANQSRLGTPRPDLVLASSVVKRRRSVSSLCALRSPPRSKGCPRATKPNNQPRASRSQTRAPYRCFQSNRARQQADAAPRHGLFGSGRAGLGSGLLLILHSRNSATHCKQAQALQSPDRSSPPRSQGAVSCLSSAAPLASESLFQQPANQQLQRQVRTYALP